MSVRVMAEVWAATGIEPRRKFVLLAFADNADEETRLAWPSKETIARKTGYSKRNVQRIIQELRDEGLLELVGTETYASGMVSVPVYRVHVPADQLGFGGGDNLTPPVGVPVVDRGRQAVSQGETERVVGGDGEGRRGRQSDSQSVSNHQEPLAPGAEKPMNPAEYLEDLARPATELVDRWIEATGIVKTRAVEKQLHGQARDYLAAGGPVDRPFIDYAVQNGCRTISGLAYFAASYRTKRKTETTYDEETVAATQETMRAIRSGER